jgi:hypothetical protein
MDFHAKVSFDHQIDWAPLACSAAMYPNTNDAPILLPAPG